MITIEMKDKVLNYLVERSDVYFFIPGDPERLFEIPYNFFKMILDRFEKMDFIHQEKFLGDGIHVKLTADIYDFYNHGGFLAQEELLATNLEKLLLEIEALKPSLPDKVSTLTTIAANIATALGLILSR